MSQKTALPGLGIPMRTILEQGHIVHAYSNANGMRVVSIEDPKLGMSWNADNSQIERSGSVHVGEGQNIGAALVHSVYKFNNVVIDSETLVIAEHIPQKVRNVLSQLDTWMQKHTGSMRALNDFDGDTIVRLEGFIADSADTAPTILSFETVEKSFFTALIAVLRKAETYTDNRAELLAELTENDEKAPALGGRDAFSALQDAKIAALNATTSRKIIVDTRARIS